MRYGSFIAVAAGIGFAFALAVQPSFVNRDEPAAAGVQASSFVRTATNLKMSTARAGSKVDMRSRAAQGSKMVVNSPSSH